MTIAIISQRKYHLQRLATVWCAIQYWNVLKRIVAEERGGEDSTLTASIEGELWTFELQVKGALLDVDVATVAKWLAHFPERTALNPFLERVGADERRMAIFIASGRCRDEVRQLSSATLRVAPKRDAIADSYAGAIRAAFAVAWDGEESNDLNKRRLRYCADLAARMEIGTLKTWLKRVQVVEQVDEAEIERRCAEILIRDFRIPSGVVGQTLTVACELVRESLGANVDLRELLNAALKARSVDRMLDMPQLYVPRGNEAQLLSRLTSERVLLLRGAPLSGKTFTARWLAQQVQDGGVHCREAFTDLTDLYRFLIASEGTEERFAVIHDPFGALAPFGDAPERRRLLDDVLTALTVRPHRRLIVTARSSVLNSISSPAEWITAGYEWCDLEPVDAVRTMEMWRRHADALALLPYQVEHVVTELAGVAIEPGAVRQLAVYLKRTGGTPNRSVLIEAALAKDAEQLGSHFRRDPRKARVLSTMALCATTTVFAAEQHLAHVLSNDETLPGHGPEFSGRSFSLGGDLPPPPAFPQYDESVRLSADDLTVLAELTGDGLLEARDGWRFSHPIYEAAALHILGRSTQAARMVRRALFSLDPRLGVLVVQRLEALVMKHENLREVLSPLLIEATNSIFPSVVDASIQAALGGVVQGEANVMRIVRAVENAFSKRDDLLWHQGRAWYDPRETRSMFDGMFGPPQARVDEAQDKLARISEGEVLDDESVYVLVSEAARTGQALDERVANVASSSDVALIRAIASKALVLQKDSRMQRFLERLDKEHSPIVLWYVVQSVPKVWRELSPATQSEVLSQVRSAIRSNRGAVLLSRLLGSVSDDEFQEEDEFAWEFWVSVLVELLSVISPTFDLEDAQIFSGVETASRYTESALITNLATVWLSWIERRATYTMVSDWGLGVVSLVLKATKEIPELRAPLIPRFFEQRDTGVQSVFVSDLVDAWSNLTELEQNCLLELLESNRKDGRWLRAFALTGEDVPSKVLESLKVPAGIFDMGPPELVRHLDSRLLADSISVWTGAPQPLWWYGKHHRNRSRWEPILLAIACLPDHPLFVRAIREGLRGLLSEAPFLASWQEVCSSASRRAAACMFDELLRACVAINGAKLEFHWNALLSCAESDGLMTVWGPMVLANIESLTSNGNIRAVTQDTRFARLLGEELKEELLVRASMSEALKAERGSSQRTSALSEIKNASVRPSWRIVTTLQMARKVVDEESPGEDWLTPFWTRFQEATRDQRDALSDEYQLPEWVTVSSPTRSQ